MEKFFIQLKRDPTVRLSCTYFGEAKRFSPKDTLIVFINGIDSPQSLFHPVIKILSKIHRAPSLPPMLTYDRPGQGLSTRNQDIVQGRPNGHGRGCLDAAHDLKDLITQVAGSHLGVLNGDINNVRIVLVGDSVGCAIARLYAQEYQRTVIGLLLLDSSIANSDIVSIFPDPKSPGFLEKDLPRGVTAELCEDARKKFRLWDPNSPSREGLWRGNLPDLLPLADAPKLEGPRLGTPCVTVVKHDPEVLIGQVCQVRYYFQSHGKDAHPKFFARR